MSSNAPHDADTVANGDIASGITLLSLADAQEVIPGLPDHLVVKHIFRSEYFDEPLHLARLRAVSRAMRDAVTATGLKFEPVCLSDAIDLGYLSTLRVEQRRWGLSGWEEVLCRAAAKIGKLEELKLLRVDGWPWDEWTCSNAAKGGHFEMLQWAHTNGCPWDERTCTMAAQGGHLEMLQWARANGCKWGRRTHAGWRRLTVTSRCCSGCARTAARGTQTHA
jgi:hypothetical protein